MNIQTTTCPHPISRLTRWLQIKMSLIVKTSLYIGNRELNYCHITCRACLFLWFTEFSMSKRFTAMDYVTWRLGIMASLTREISDINSVRYQPHHTQSLVIIRFLPCFNEFIDRNKFLIVTSPYVMLGIECIIIHEPRKYSKCAKVFHYSQSFSNLHVWSSSWWKILYFDILRVSNKLKHRNHSLWGFVINVALLVHCATFDILFSHADIHAVAGSTNAVS